MSIPEDTGKATSPGGPPGKGVRGGHPPGGGLCTLCRHGEEIVSAKGSRFLLCRLSATDPDFPKYPRLPVLKCEGFLHRGGNDPET